MLAETFDLLTSLPFWVAVLRIATPLILGTLGVLLCERAGVLNLGIEGRLSELAQKPFRLPIRNCVPCRLWALLHAIQTLL